MSTRGFRLGSPLRKTLFSSSLTRSTLIRSTAKRIVQTESLPASASAEILNKQRLLRPLSPDFTIYQPQLTWIGSITSRAMGGGFSALLYGFALAYLVAPGTFDSVHVVEFIAALPAGVKYAGKALLAAPFAFHGLNGIRHLSWDMTKFERFQAVYSR
ncbi:succinate dehydrogenase cytochrome b560 subunit [Mycena rebaudengoi]|nr:succinate dehydrogenase cytochrome b560 subunit [Mycena rebaudengoi]